MPPSTSRKTLTAIATVSALAAGGAALAGAATSTTPSKPSSSQRPAQTALTGDTADKVKTGRGGGKGGPGHRGGPGRPRQAALTGDTAAKVKAAALEKVPGGTVLRSEKGGPGGAAYHAHVRKSDGTEVVVLVNSSFQATSVETAPAGGKGGPGHRGGPRGGGEALTGTTAAKVKAAALGKVPGGTVLETEKGGHGATYHAHVRKADGSEVVVLVNGDFEAIGVESDKRPRP